MKMISIQLYSMSINHKKHLERHKPQHCWVGLNSTNVTREHGNWSIMIFQTTMSGITQGKQWFPQKKGRTIGQVYATNAAQGERQYLWMLLHHIPGPLSYDHLRTLPDGTKCGSFKETAICLGLLVTDDEWEECLTEASASYLPSQICSLFVTILVFGEPLKPYDLWMKHKDAMCEDILWKVSKMESIHLTKLSGHVDNSILLLLQNDPCELATSLDNFGMPTPNTDDIVYGYPCVMQDEIFEVSEQQTKSQRNIATFNLQQALAHQMILQSVLDSEYPQRLFFINAPGGYDKTFLMETLLSTVCSMGKIALAVTSSWITVGRWENCTFMFQNPHSNMCWIYVFSITPVNTCTAYKVNISHMLGWNTNEQQTTHWMHWQVIAGYMKSGQTLWRNNMCFWWWSISDVTCCSLWGLSTNCKSMC